MANNFMVVAGIASALMGLTGTMLVVATILVVAQIAKRLPASLRAFCSVAAAYFLTATVIRYITAESVDFMMVRYMFNISCLFSISRWWLSLLTIFWARPLSFRVSSTKFNNEIGIQVPNAKCDRCFEVCGRSDNSTIFSSLKTSPVMLI